MISARLNLVAKIACKVHVMTRKSIFSALLATVTAVIMAGSGAPPGANAADQIASPASAAALVAEVRHSFTIHGKPIPPEIFRDFGDGDLADSGSIWVTIDAAAAIGSNLYYDPIKRMATTLPRPSRRRAGAIPNRPHTRSWAPRRTA
jgi:hypothetical protein